MRRSGHALSLPHVARPAVVSSLRRSAGRSGVRLHPHRDDLVTLVGARLDHPGASPSQPLSDPADRARRRRDDGGGRDAGLRGAGRDPAAGDGCARLPLRAARDRGLGGELHRGRDARPRRPRRRGGLAARAAAEPAVPLAEEELARLSALCRDLHEERFLAREGHRLAMRGYLALLAIAVARLAASRARTGAITLKPADPTVEALRALLERTSARNACSASTPRSSP